MAAVDFKKVFDSVDHDALWESLAKQKIAAPYIKLLQTLYTNQVATVKTDRQSRQFNVQRGVKQGDPLSSLFFNALLEDLFKTLKLRWTQPGHGIKLGDTPMTKLTNLRFTDNVLLIAPTLTQLTSMLTDSQRESA
eukprot:5574495-Karenia_brevis.AAC.1